MAYREIDALGRIKDAGKVTMTIVGASIMVMARGKYGNKKELGAIKRRITDNFGAAMRAPDAPASNERPKPDKGVPNIGKYLTYAGHFILHVMSTAEVAHLGTLNLEDGLAYLTDREKGLVWQHRTRHACRTWDEALKMAKWRDPCDASREEMDILRGLPTANAGEAQEEAPSPEAPELSPAEAAAPPARGNPLAMAEEAIATMDAEQFAVFCKQFDASRAAIAASKAPALALAA